MGLKQSKGNMYKWCTHTHTHLGGICHNNCKYCYVETLSRQRYHDPKYLGETRLIEEELDVDYGSGKIIFIEHCNDICGDGVKIEWVERILEHCRRYPDNTYIFQTKNPLLLKLRGAGRFPSNMLVGTTIETDNETLLEEISDVGVTPMMRAIGLAIFAKMPGVETFVTIEPILKFNLDRLLLVLRMARPNWINIGADSKGHGLPEPSSEEISQLISDIEQLGIGIVRKSNLQRLFLEK